MIGMFQSTPLREGRRDTGALSEGEPMFQSTPLREGRRIAGAGSVAH